MKFERNPRDRHYRERLAGSTLASVLIHALLALLLVSIIASSSEEGATENVEGGSVVTLERISPAVVANQPAAARAELPMAHVPRIAPVRHAAMVQPQTQRIPQNRHELAREAPTAPPNPRPLPQQSAQPNPQPTQNVYEVQPRTEVPAAPVSVPTVAPVSVALKSYRKRDAVAGSDDSAHGGALPEAAGTHRRTGAPAESGTRGERRAKRRPGGGSRQRRAEHIAGPGGSRVALARSPRRRPEPERDRGGCSGQDSRRGSEPRPQGSRLSGSPHRERAEDPGGAPAADRAASDADAGTARDQAFASRAEHQRQTAFAAAQ